MEHSRSFKDRLEIVTNALIIVVILAIGGSYVMSRLNHNDATLPVGTKIDAPPGYQWQNYSKTLIVGVREGCIFCEHSYPLYRKLEAMEHDHRMSAHMLFVMPDNPVAAAALLRSQDITSASVPDVALSNLKISGTPTLLLVDANGRLLKSWVGELDSAKSDELVAALRR